MKTKKTAPKGAIHEILAENGLKIAGWETANCGYGIEFPAPVIVDAVTEERIDIGPVKCPATQKGGTAE